MWKYKRLQIEGLKARRMTETKAEKSAKGNFRKYMKKFTAKKAQGQSFDNTTEFTYIIKSVYKIEDDVIRLNDKALKETVRVDKISNMLEFICQERGISQERITEARS